MSFDFTTLVTDRTQSDVQRVRSVAAKIINGTASAAEIAEWNAANMRGAYNYTDLNRVTAAIEALKSTLEGYGYTVPGYKRIEIPREESSTSRLPAGHTELKYIAGTGTQYIDTGAVLSNLSGVEMKLQLTSNSITANVFGSRTSATENNFCWMQVSEKLQIDYQNYSNNRFVYSAGTNVLTISLRPPKCIVNTSTYTISGAASFTTPASAYIFHTSGSPSSPYCGQFKLFYCQIYDNGTLVRDYVPDMTDDGQVGLYDLVGGKFYPNAGTGAFIAGPVVEQTPATGGDDKDPYLWYETDIPTPELMAAYLANVSAIRSVLDMLPTTPAVPADMERMTTDKANAIERILADINTLIHNMIAAWFYSGEIYSGEV